MTQFRVLPPALCAREKRLVFCGHDQSPIHKKVRPEKDIKELELTDLQGKQTDDRA